MAVFYNIITLSEDPAGIKVIENPTKTIKAVLFPREYLSDFNRLEEARQAGVYILYNTIDKNEQPHIYIGQTGYNITSRLNNHNKKKDFWNQAIVFVEKGDFLNLNPAHAKIIESILIQKANECGAVVMDNSTGSRAPRVQKADMLAAETWADEVMTITKIIGLAFFVNQGTTEEKTENHESANTGAGASETEKVNSVIPDGIYTMDRKSKKFGRNFHGIMEVKNGRTYLKAGSQLIPEVSKSLSAGHVELRKQLKLKDNVLQEDVLLQSPSACGEILIGASCNGWTAWKNADGSFIDSYRKEEH